MSEDGSEEAPSLPKRKPKKILLSDSSSSDSDDSVTAPRTRRNRLRLVSDGSDSGSGSSIVRTASRRKRLWPLPDASSSESDSWGWLPDKSDPQQPVASTSKAASGSASDSSEGNSEKCSICLMRFTTQKVGTPQPCDHIFCLDCITEWSKNVNTCPVDRMKFDAIVVRLHAGGRVLRTDPVKVVERRPSVDIFEFENTTACEICHSTADEETMLLCDGCDLGFHMQCLTPPLDQVPISHWFCPTCYERDMLSNAHLMPRPEDLLNNILDIDLPTGDDANPFRYSRQFSAWLLEETNRGATGDSGEPQQGPSTSSTSNAPSGSNQARTTTRRATASRRRKYKRRRTKTVIVEYELKNGRKFPVTRKRRLKKRKTRKRQPRTAAHLSFVRANVRARLAAQAQRPAAGRGARPTTRPAPLAAPPLRLFGDPNHLDYFSDDEGDASEAASAAVACRPTANILSAFRQARRKNMIAIPSPPHASSAPDLLADILESQTLLHSKDSVISVTVDGHVDVKLQSRRESKPKTEDSKAEKVDLSKGCDAAKKVPSYPGQSRGGGGGWGGGYRGNYHREQGANADNFARGGNYEGGGFSNHRGRPGNAFNQNNARRDETDSYGDFPRRSHHYSHGDDNFDRHRRPPDLNRGPNHGRNSLAPSWPPYGGSGQSASNRREARPRHSFGGFENPLDMRVGQATAHPADSYAGREEPPSQAFRPLPEPPLFKFDGGREVERSEEERSDDGLIIDTEKYDPTEPTNDEDSGDEERTPSLPAPPPFPPPLPALPPPPAPPAIVQDIIAGIDAATINVPPNVLDTAVRQVLREHRNLIVPPADYDNDKSDHESDGDCPNFSIYSATSVHIANSSESALTNLVQKETSDDNLEDLVQEDDDVTAPEPPAPIVESLARPALDSNHKRKKEEEYKEKVSKRCPITPNTRNPIKIKLNTPSLIKRHVSLYDEEDDVEEETVASDKTEPTENTKDSQNALDQSSERKTPPKDFEMPEQFVKSHFQEVESLNEEKEPSEEDRESVCNENEENSVPQSGPSDDEIFKKEGTDPIRNGDKLLKNEDETVAEKSEIGEDRDLESEHREPHSEDNVDISDNEVDLNSQCSKKETTGRNEDVLEKMTESISETEDERSYTPCLDENKEKGIEGLDTEMISEEEGNEIFSDNEKATSDRSRTSPAPVAPDGEEGEILDGSKRTEDRDDAKKKKKKESKKESKDKKKNKGQKGEVAFKKLSRSGKERNYREREKEEKSKSKKERRDSSDANERERRKEQKRKEKRKDLARYDVRTIVSEKRKKQKDPFGRDVSPPSPSRSPRDPSGERTSPSLSRIKKSPTPLRASPASRRSPAPRRRPRSGTPPSSRAASPPPRRLRPSPTPPSSPEAAARSRKRRISSSPRRRSRLRRSPSPRRRVSPRRRRSASRGKKRPRRSVTKSPKPKAAKKKKRSRSERPPSRTRRRGSPRRKSPKRKKTKRRSVSPVAPEPAVGAWSPLSVDSRLPSPRTPPADHSPPPLRALLAGDSRRRREKRRRPERPRHRRAKELGGSKEVFTSGDNILVSVSFKDQERDGNAEADAQRRRRERRERRRRRRKAAVAPELESAKPVAIIDLERSPFRELTPSPKNVIVLSDDERGAPEPERPPPAPAQPEPAHEPPPQFPTAAVGPKTPPEPSAQPQVKFTIAPKPTCPPRTANPLLEGEERPASADGAATPADPPSSPDAYDPFEPTRSASASPARPPSPDRPSMTLEAAQKTNLSADEVLDRRPLSPMEKVMALLQSQRDVSPEPLPTQAPPSDAGAETPAAGAPAVTPAPATSAPCAAAQRIVLPSPTRPQPKLFLAKPSPIKSNPVKPMQATKISKLPLPAHGESPYSPGSSDFGDLFEPPPPRQRRDGFDALFDAKPRGRKDRANAASVAKVPVKLNRKKGKTQVGIKIDDDSLKILDELPSSAVEMQVKSKFLKKLNRQERVVEEVKLVLKPHYNKKHVTKDEYKDILRRAVPKICHNKTGEINPPKIQSLVEAYVKKYRKKHKLGLL